MANLERHSRYPRGRCSLSFNLPAATRELLWRRRYGGRMAGDRRVAVLCGLLTLSFLLPPSRKAPDARRIKSPDGKLVAVFLYVGKDKGFEDLECRFEMR